MDVDLDLYEKMYLIRMCEEKIIELYPDDDMKTPMHMSMGSEAIAVGVCQALSPEDQVFGYYRSHALFLAKTGDTDEFFAEMYGKDSALLKGKGGSMHMCLPDKGFMGTSGIVASTIPVAVGAAFANKVKGNGNLVAVFFGDGATNEGVFWESLNAACLMKLPIIFVCEDNGYAVHTPKWERNGYESITKIVEGFDCYVGGFSVPSVSTVSWITSCAMDHIRRMETPAFLHFEYWRHLEHVGINEDYDAGYRTKEEANKWKDPLALQRRKLEQRYGETDVLILEMKIVDRIMDSIIKAVKAPYCSIEELTKEVY